MLEIKINNEEMCCNNVNEIKESILQPTNLILKNCYPMEWEKDHDYTSKFFYPKLWSKCIINEKGNSEVVEGKNIYIENAKSDYSNKLKIIGESKQETTEGYNLCPNELQTTSLNGLTFTVNEDKSITVNGTATKETTVFITKNLNLTTGDYYFSGCIGGSPSTYNMIIFGLTSVYNGERKETIETNKTYSVGIVVFANQKMNNVIYKPMVTKIAGNSYEPYTGGVASPNPDYPQEIESLNGYNLFNQNYFNTVGNEKYNYDSVYFLAIEIPKISKTKIMGNIFLKGISQNLVLGFSDKTTVTKYRLLDNGTLKNNVLMDFSNWNKVYLIIGNSNGISKDRKEIQNILENYNIQLTEGTEIKEYKSYGEIEIKQTGKKNEKNIANLKNITPLRSVNEVKDECNKENTIKKIGHYEFTGNETNIIENSVLKGLFQITLSNVLFDNTKKICFSNYLIGETGGKITTSSKDNLVATASNNRIFMKINKYSNNIAGLKQWLKNKKAEGNPVYIDYVLKEPIIKPLTAEDKTEINKIQLFEGYNNIELISNGLGNIEITYNIEKLIFAGAVKNTGNISLNPRMPKYANVEVIDFKSLLSEGDTLDFVITKLTIPEAIIKVIDNIKEYGFIVGNINIKDKTTIIGAYNTQNQTAYDVFQYLSDISNSVWLTRVIDENKIAIDFYDTDLLPSKKPIEYTEKYFCDNSIIDMSYNLNSRDYRNKQVVISNNIISSIITEETIILDGYNQKIELENKIGEMEGIWVDGIPKTIITNEEKNYGLMADFYFTLNSNIIEFEKKYNAGTKLNIKYKAVINGRQITEDKKEIDYISNSINRKGKISRYEVRNDIENNEQLLKIAETYLNQKGKEQITLKIKTKKDLYNCGDSIEFKNSPIKELSTKYMVKNKTTQIIGNNTEIFYLYELVNNYNKENSINYFDNQRRKVSGNIETDKVVIRNIDFENSINIIFKNIKITEIESSGDNILNCELNTPFVE